MQMNSRMGIKNRMSCTLMSKAAGAHKKHGACSNAWDSPSRPAGGSGQSRAFPSHLIFCQPVRLKRPCENQFLEITGNTLHTAFHVENHGIHARQFRLKAMPPASYSAAMSLAVPAMFIALLISYAIIVKPVSPLTFFSPLSSMYP